MGSAVSGPCGSIALPHPAPYSTLSPAPHHPTLDRLRSPAIDLSLDLSDGHQGGGRVSQEKSKGSISILGVCEALRRQSVRNLDRGGVISFLS